MIHDLTQNCITFPLLIPFLLWIFPYLTDFDLYLVFSPLASTFLASFLINPYMVYLSTNEEKEKRGLLFHQLHIIINYNHGNGSWNPSFVDFVRNIVVMYVGSLRCILLACLGNVIAGPDYDVDISGISKICS